MGIKMVKDIKKTKEQLIDELNGLRRRITEMEGDLKGLPKEGFRDSMEVYRVLVEYSLQGIIIIKDGRIIFANAAFSEISGYTIDELLYLSPDKVKAMIHPEDQALVWGRFQARLEGKPAPPRYEFRWIGKDGKVRWLEMMSSRIVLRGTYAIQGSIVDVTGRKRAEDALLESEEKYRQFVESANEGIVLTKEGKIVYINPRALEVLGYSEKEILSRNLIVFLHPDDRERVLELYGKKLKGQDIPPATFRIITREGSMRWVESRSTVLTDESKQALLTFLTDITERRQMEEMLKDAEWQKSAILDSLVEHVIHEDMDMKIQWANQAACKSAGMTREELIGRYCYEIWQQRRDPCPDCPVRNAMNTGQLREIEKSTPDGRIWYIRGYPIRDLQGALMGGTEVTLEITERRRAEEASRKSEERYRSLFDRLTVGVYQSTPDGKFLDVNPAFITMLGCPDLETLLSTPVAAFYKNPEEREQWKNLAGKEGNSISMEVQWQKLDGTPLWVRESARVVRNKQGVVQYYEGVAEDITEYKRSEENQKNMEAYFQTAQRMEAIGTLAGGIAHDFNNILSAIMGYTEIALFHEPSKDSLTRQSLKQVLLAGERAKDLVKQILAFGRQADKERKPMILKPLVKETLKLVRATLPSTIEIRQHIPTHTGYVMADPTQMHQVLMNLCTNAYHAMREKGGVLKVSLRDVELDPDYTAKYPDVHPGPYIELTVGDTGHGIKEKEVHRIFEPYFTTKEKGEGTGMGLSVVHGIVKEHGGAIRVHSEPGKGTTFTIFLPRIKAPEVEAKPEEITSLPTGGERILFVDDEPAINDICKRMLERLGYTLEARTSPIEALEAFRARPGKFDLVITDMTMPKMTGDELAKEIMAIRPDIPIILCTGFSERINEEKAQAIGIRGFVMKPFVIRDFVNTIRKALNQEKEK